MNDTAQKIFDMIRQSPKQVTVLPCDDSISRQAREQYPADPESALGVVLDQTGGIVIDGWIRVYGSGPLNILARNALFPYDDLVVAEDVLGGLFLFLKNGNIGYFAPDSLETEDLEVRYSQFLSWCLHGDTDQFYADLRWAGWQEDAAALSLSDGVVFYPFLWADAESLESRKRSVVPMKEIIGLEMDCFRQLQQPDRE